ncbi:MAG: hypothetical protein HY744_27595 [Deltaproteobacteria bacterium]|nr:hypothetical protein [Deltaproteobacteria bacterium]
MLRDLGAPPPLQRFQVLYERALDFANYAAGLGQTLLSAFEKQDAEQLAALRSTHEVALLALVRNTRELQVKEATASREALDVSKEAAGAREAHYAGLIETDSATETGGETAAEREQSAISRLEEARILQAIAYGHDGAAAAAHFIPTFEAGTSGQVAHTVVKFGGTDVGQAITAGGALFKALAAEFRDVAAKETTMAGYIRRRKEWDLQRSLAEIEGRQIQKQIDAAKIRETITTSELTSHERQLEDAKAVLDFLSDKFTNDQLYTRLGTQLLDLHRQAYNLAFAMARRAQRTFQFERVEPTASFVAFGHFDSAQKGLLAGEKLLFDLRRMQAAYLEKDRREYEITKNVSLAEQFPRELIVLRETGAVEVTLSEQLFDLDYPGHYVRRLKSVSLTIPAVTGPHTSINCKLTLLKNKIRTKSLLRDGDYKEDESGEDSRFLYGFGAVASVCTSRGLNDAGMFELNFRDERLLPFEGAGAVSTWRIELPPETNRFDLRALTDVVLHVQYTAREGGSLLGEAAKRAAFEGILPKALRIFSVKTEFEEAWSALETELVFPHPEDPFVRDQVLTLTFDSKLPFVPGVGAVRLRRLRAAFDVEHPDAAQVAVTADVTIDGNSNSILLKDASVEVAVIDYDGQGVAIEGSTLTLKVADANIDAVDAKFREEYPPGQGTPPPGKAKTQRLKPSVFRDLYLILDLERDPPVV